VAVSCEPSDLAQAAKCFCFSDQRQVDGIIIYLLAQIAEDTHTPAQLAQLASCFCYPDGLSRNAVMLYLLCAIADASGA
jgi:hypothetical protein